MKLDFGAPGRIVFSEKFACPVSGFTIAEIEPRLFSFNAPQGACPACDGLGEKLVFDPDLIVPNPALSIADGAIDPWGERASGETGWTGQIAAALKKDFGIPLDRPWKQLTPRQREIILYGTGDKRVTVSWAGKHGGGSWAMRSTTTSMSCLYFLSSAGASSMS